jgi:hypothetical protein
MQPFKRDLLDTISKMSAAQIIFRGFQIKCPKCSTANWHPLRNIDEIITCPGCLQSFPLPVQYPAGSEIEWEYTLNTLVNRMMDHDGLPHILALEYLSRSERVYAPVPGLQLRKGGQDVLEFDFVCVIKGEVIGGECKVGGRLSSNDLDKARKACSFKFSRFYFCSLGEFTEETKSQIGTVSREIKNFAPDFMVGVIEQGEIKLSNSS